MDNIIEVNNLTKKFSSIEALKGISFAVKTGEIFGLLGPNGAGKTTTLEILEGLKKPTSGEVKICGFNSVTESKQVKGKIGVQLQSSEYFPSVTLAELINLFASFYHRKVDPLQLLDKVNLREKSREVVKNLSGGQKHRFAMAVALVNNPEVLFLDEPTTGLDPRVRREIWQLIKKLNEQGVTVLITTHYMEEAEYLCDRTAIIDNGRILTIDQPRNLINKLSHTSQLSFFTDNDVPQEWFKDIKDVEKIYRNDPKIILEIKSLDVVPVVLKKLQDHKISFSGFTVKAATLEDVYLDLTGRELAVNHIQ